MTLTVELRGLIMGTGTVYDVQVNGTNWRSVPDLRSNPLPRAGRHGTQAGQDLLGGRRFPITVQIVAATMAEALDAEGALAAAWAPSDVDLPIVITDDNGAWRMTGRPQMADPDLEFADVGLITSECRFLATDPIRYSDTASSDSTTFPAGGVGFTFPFTFPLAFGTSGAGGRILADNTGRAAVPWTATITGPWTNPTITHVGLSRTLTVNVTLGAGDVLTVDSKSRSILLGGTASRYSSLVQPASWFDLDPGVNEIRFGGASGSGSAGLAWLSGSL